MVKDYAKADIKVFLFQILSFRYFAMVMFVARYIVFVSSSLTSYFGLYLGTALNVRRKERKGNTW